MRSNGLPAFGVVAILALSGCAAAPPPVVHGTVAPGFEEVREEVAKNLRDRGEKGCAVAVYLRGQKVVDLWAGERDDGSPWEEHTLVPIYSTTKGVAALVLAIAHARGWLDYDAEVARYWPEFAAAGKAHVTVRQLLSHQAGLVLLDQEIPYDTVHDLDALAPILARQAPSWTPGTRHGYHLSTLGFYMNELFRRVEPRRRSIGRFLAEEIAPALDLELYLGAPESIGPARVARVETTSPLGGLAHVTDPPFAVLTRLLSPWSTMTRTFAIPVGYDVNDPRWWRVEIPSGNGLATARSVARLYGVFAAGGRELGVGPRTLAELEAPPRLPTEGTHDEVLGVDSWYGLGFIKPALTSEWGVTLGAYGMPGAGGSFAFADPDLGMGYAYVMNRMGYRMSDDPREKSLRDAVYRAIEARARASRGRGKIPSVPAVR